jgi:hypothetical protein
MSTESKSTSHKHKYRDEPMQLNQVILEDSQHVDNVSTTVAVSTELEDQPHLKRNPVKLEIKSGNILTIFTLIKGMYQQKIVVQKQVVSLHSTASSPIMLPGQSILEGGALLMNISIHYLG